MKKISIHSVPRSGSTWLGCIFDSNVNVAYRYQPLFSYTHKSQLNEDSNKKDINTFFDDILNTKDDFVLQKDAIAKGIVPHFKKEKITHVVYKEVRYHNILENLLKTDDDLIVIGLIRNPLAVINSWLRAPKEFKKELGWNELEEWRFAHKKNLNKPEEFNGFEKWKDVTLLFEKLKHKYPQRFFLLKYDDLLNSTIEVVEQIFRFCNLQIQQQTLDFIRQSKIIDKSNEAYSVYRKKNFDDRWKTELNPLIANAVREELENSEFEKYIL